MSINSPFEVNGCPLTLAPVSASLSMEGAGDGDGVSSVCLATSGQWLDVVPKCPRRIRATHLSVFFYCQFQVKVEKAPDLTRLKQQSPTIHPRMAKDIRRNTPPRDIPMRASVCVGCFGTSVDRRAQRAGTACRGPPPTSLPQRGQGQHSPDSSESGWGTNK